MKIKASPREGNAGNLFECALAADVLPEQIVAAVEKGVHSVWANGLLLGFPLVDMLVELLDGTWDADESTTVAFEIAARAP